MTYGDNTTEMREQLTHLLRQHRIVHRLGGPGPHTVPESTTAEERHELSHLVQRFRSGVLTWCLEAVIAGSNADRDAPNGYRLAEQLKSRLESAVAASSTGLPSLSELTTTQRLPMVETWRRAARAAALGEHDLGPGTGQGAFPEAEARTIVKDAADLVRGLVVLDARYKNVPGWNHLNNPVRLLHAAEACSTYLSTEAGFTVDHRGWRPPPALLPGPPRPGFQGVLQAQENVVHALAELPTALNLRRIVHSQASMSREAARCASKVAPDLTDRFVERQQVYRALLAQTRELGGLIGKGSTAAAEAANAVGRLQNVGPSEPTDAALMHELRRLLTRTDARLATVLERGFAERLYYVGVPTSTTYGVSTLQAPTAEKQWIPVTAFLQPELLSVVKQRLRPPLPPRPDPRHQQSRHDYTAALNHRPERRASRPSL